MTTADIAVLGAGSWGTALALHLARSGRGVRLWAHDPSLAARMNQDRINTKYLPDHPLPRTVIVTSGLAAALEGAGHVLVVVPSHHCREVLRRCLPHVTGSMRFCIAAKGIETDTLMTVSRVLGDVAGEGAVARTAVLSGPSFAREVAAGHPTAVVIAADDADMARAWQTLISAGGLRAYTSSDVTGVELGGALKNVIAIGAGVVEGLGLGSNTLAALITRGLAEISRLAESLGGRRETLAGLAGLGDLVLTCTGSLSRNRALGAALGRGTPLAAAQAATPMVAEGIRTALSARRLSARQGVEMPITGQVHAVLYEGKGPREAIGDLLGRELRSEEW